MSGIAGKIFGQKRPATPDTPATGFEGLPRFARLGLTESVEAARGFLKDPSIFAPTATTPEQLQALDVLRLGAQPLTAERFGQQRAIFEDPFLQEVLDPALADLARAGVGAFGDIGAQASAAGAFGGSRQALREAELGQRLGQESGRLSGQLRSEAFQTSTDRALQQLQRQQTGASQLFNVGEILRSLETQRQQAPIRAADFLRSSVEGVPQQGELKQFGLKKKTEFTPGSIIEGTEDVAQIAALLFGSDIRLKEDIKLIGEENGHNIYQFRYIDQPEVYEGVMAHEVEKIMPEAVSEKDGFMMVDYSMIDVEMRRVA